MDIPDTVPRNFQCGRFPALAFSFLLMLSLAGCGGSSSSPASTDTTISGTVTAENILTASTSCVNELQGADVYLYDADRLDWVYPVARTTTGSDCSYTLRQLINSDFNRNPDGSRAYNDNNPIPEGNYTVIASNNILVTGGTRLVAVQAQIAHFKGPVTGHDLVAYSSTTTPVVERILGYTQNPDGSFCGAGTVIGNNEALQISFNMAMARVSVINNIVIMNGFGSSVTGSWAVSADLLSATFYPEFALAQTMGYTMHVDAAMQNVYGTRLAASTSCTFAAGAANTNVPQAVWYAPASATNVPVNTTIQIASSKYLDMGTMQVSATPSIGTKPTVLYVGNISTVAGKPYVYEIVPDGLLAYSTSYNISISGALDLASNPLATLSTSFVTMAAPTPPVVTSTTPVSMATGVALNAQISAVFSSQMDPLTVNATSVTLNDGIANVAGNVSYNTTTKTVVFTPVAPLVSNSVYTAQISASVTDINGLAMTATHTWSFTTLQNLADIAPPTVPSNLVATAAGTSQINLSWWPATDNVAVAGYKIYDSAGVLLASTTVTSYSHIGLIAGTQYCYRVSAIDAAGNESGQSLLGCDFTSAPAISGAGTWTATATTGAPSARPYHTAVWTGTKMIVWGGVNNASTGINDFTVNTGGLYDPLTNTWAATSIIGAPSIRYDHSAVWTGSKMIVWGGTSYGGNYIFATNSGGTYDPVTNTWTATTISGAPSARQNHTAVWTGTEMIVWGGADINGIQLNDGGRYNPATNSWSPMNTTGAPVGRSGATAVWTGSKMIVWGGYSYQNGHIFHNTGGIYDPTTNTWSPIAILNAPSGRISHTAVWSGTLLIIHGGWAGTYSLNSGGRYDPTTDTWTDIWSGPYSNQQAAVWTGSKMILWSDGYGSGWIYDPATNSWTPTTNTGAPPTTAMLTAVWTGTQMIVWGGYNGSVFYNTGGIFTP